MKTNPVLATLFAAFISIPAYAEDVATTPAPELTAEITAALLEWDTDGDGQLSEAELAVMEQQNDQTAAAQELLKNMQTEDLSALIDSDAQVPDAESVKAALEALK